MNPARRPFRRPAAETLEPRLLLATMSGRVFNDVSADGLWDTTEPGVPGWTVYFDANNNGVRDTGEESTVVQSTINGGFYSLAFTPHTNLPATCTIRDVPAPGWVRTAPPGGSFTVSVNSAAATFAGRNFAARPFAAPTSPQGSGRSFGVRVLFTDGSTNETQFILERRLSTQSDTAFAEVSRTTSSTGQSTGGRYLAVDTTAVAGVAYAYRVRATDGTFVSGATAPVTVVAGSPGGAGVRATYYNERFFTGPAVTLDSLSAAQHDFGNGSPDPRIDTDTFSGVFTGLLQAEFTDTYTFYTASDDGIDFELSDPDTGQVLLAGPPGGINVERAMSPLVFFQDTIGQVPLQAGKRYAVRWRFSENTGLAGFRVGWSFPGFAADVLPQDLLFGITTPAGVNATAVCDEQVTVAFTDTSAGESGFQLERAEGLDGAFHDLAILPASRGGPVTFVDKGTAADPLTVGQLYSYRVRALGLNNVRGMEDSDYSAPAEAIPTMNTPELVTGGGARYDPGRNLLVLTGNPGTGGGSAFTADTWHLPGGGLTASFNYRASAGFPGQTEGFAFVLQRSGPVPPVGFGAGLGFEGLANSVAVKFDLSNGFAPRSAVYANGYYDPGGTQIPFNISNGDTYRIDLRFDPVARAVIETVTDLTIPGSAPFQTTFPVAFTQQGSQPVDVPVLIGGDCAYVGLTGSSQSIFGEQLVTNLTVNGTPIPLAPPAPHVTGVSVAGSGWSDRFGQSVRAAGAGSARNGVAVPAAQQQLLPMPWAGLNEITVTFDHDVVVDAADLTVTGRNQPTYPLDPTAFRYDAVTHTATWRLASGRTFGADRLLLVLDGDAPQGVRTPAGVPLDGEWADPSTSAAGDLFPSGDGVPGGDFRFRINVLPADTDRSGAVTAADVLSVRSFVGGRYSVFADVDADGVVNARDFTLVRRNLGDALPAAQVQAFFSDSPVALPARSGFTRRSVYALFEKR